MLSTPPRDTRDVDTLLKYSESLNALRRRVAIEQARSKGRDAAVVPSEGKSEPVLDVIVRTSPIRGDPRSFDESPFKPEAASASMGLTQRHHSFADELNTVLALASPGASASDAAASHEALLARSSATAAGFKFAELLTETEHLSDVVTSLRREAAEREASWQERVRLLKLDIDDRDKKIDQHRATEEKLTLAVDQLKARLDAVNAPNTNQVEASLRRSLAELESRYRALEDDTLQRDQLIRFQETEIRRLEALVSATSAAVAEAERRSAAAVEEAATRVSQLEDERLLLLSQKRDADLALAATRTSLTALSASLSSPPRRSASGAEAIGVADDNAAEADDANSSSISAVVVKLHAELEAVRQRCSHLQTEHLKGQHQSVQLKTRCEGLAAKVVEAETQRAHADGDLAAARDEMTRMKAARTADESKRQQLKNALDRAQRQIDAAAAESASQVRGLEDELRLKQLRIGHLEASLADAEKRLREAIELGSESENRVRTRVSDLEAQLQLAEAELNQMSSRLEQEKASAARAVALSGDAQERIAELEQRLLAEEQAARERVANASLAIAELKREGSSLRSEAAAAVERSEAALRDAQTARKQRDVALERNTLLQASLQKELDNATASAKSQLKQLAGVLARREDEVSRLRERVAVLEATQTANTMAIEQQQLTLDAMYNHSAQHTASKNRSRPHE